MVYQLQAFEDVYTRPGCTVVRDWDAFIRMMTILGDARVIAFDTETSGLVWWAHARAIGYAFATRVGGQILSWYVPVRHQTGEPQLAFESVSMFIAMLLVDSHKLVIGHHLKFDEHIIHQDRWRLGGQRYDTMIGARIYDENRPLALKVRAAEDLGHRDAHESEALVQATVASLAKASRLGIEAYKAQYGYAQVPVSLLGIYACLDAQYTYELYELYERFGVSRDFSRIWETEMQLIGVLGEMEETGMLVDVPYLTWLKDATSGAMAGLDDRIRSILGGSMFRISSDDELRDFLLCGLKLPLWRKTKGKQLAVDAEALSEFVPVDHSGVLKLILEWRSAEKINSTYTTSILEKLDSHNRLHGSFNQAGTTTGRLSSSGPNLQNFSTDDPDRAAANGGKDPWSIRRAFLVDHSKRPRVMWDFSQIELRILAHYSKDPIMVDNYLKNGDIHQRTADEVGVSRRGAKCINFGLAYCLSAPGLARQTGMSVPEAEKFMRIFFDRYRGVDLFRKGFWSGVSQHGCQFRNMYGRPRRVPDIVSKDKFLRQRAERQAIGTLIQGTAAELTKIALVRLDKWIKTSGVSAKLISTVHDEIWADCDASEFAQVAQNGRDIMQAFPEFKPIPILVSGAYTTTNWGEKKEAWK
jgi:DNA polymerase-1